MKKIIFKILSVVLGIVFAFLIPALGALVNLFVVIDNQIFVMIMIGINIILFLYAIFNIIVSNKIERKIKMMNGQEILDEVLSKKEEANHYLEEIRNRNNRIRKHALFKTIITLLIYFISLFIDGLLFFSNIEVQTYKWVLLITTVIIISSIILPYLVMTFNGLFSSIKRKKEDDKIKYPVLHEFIGKILESEGIIKKYNVYIVDAVNASISEEKDRINISIGSIILKFFSLEEIKSVIYHEIAHYLHEDTNSSLKNSKIDNAINVLLPLETYKMFSPLIGKTMFNVILMELISNHIFEEKADDYVLEKNVGKEYATAAIKMFGLSYAFRMPFFKIEEMICKDHKWTDETIKAYFQEYLNFYNRHIERFIYVSKNHLDPRVFTHPTVKQRVDKFAPNVELDVSIVESHYFDSDIKAFYEEVNETKLKNEKEERFNNILTEYGQYNEKKKDLINNNFDVPETELIPVLDSAYRYGDFDFVKQISCKILENNPSNSRANLLLGATYAFYDFDDRCIEYLQKVYRKENEMFKEDACNILGEYCLIMGKAEIRDEIREMFASDYDKTVDMEEVLTIRKNDKLKKYSDETIINDIISIAAEFEGVQGISIGTKWVNNMYSHHVMMIIVDYDKNEKSIESAYEKIWSYLDLKEEQFSLTKINMKYLPKNHPFRNEPLIKYMK